MLVTADNGAEIPDHLPYPHLYVYFGSKRKGPRIARPGWLAEADMPDRRTPSDNDKVVVGRARIASWGFRDLGRHCPGRVGPDVHVTRKSDDPCSHAAAGRNCGGREAGGRDGGDSDCDVQLREPLCAVQVQQNVDPDVAVRDGWDANRAHFSILNDLEKRITALAIKETKADVLTLQEVENLDTLKRFRNQFLGGARAYPHALAVDGNDPRLIDVGVLSKFPIVHARSYQHLRAGRVPLFSRDCLEVDVDVPGGPLTLFINHFKSMLDKKDPCKGRAKTRPARQRQADAVREIATARFGADAGSHRFVVLGDLNDYLEADTQGRNGIEDLVAWDAVVNVVDRLPEDERWTHFYKGNNRCGIPPAYRQLDYVLVSKALAEPNPGSPTVVRKGMPERAERYTGPRFDGIGRDKPKASDHCPVTMMIDA